VPRRQPREAAVQAVGLGQRGNIGEGKFAHQTVLEIRNHVQTHTILDKAGI
jgi:hypothetical protein